MTQEVRDTRTCAKCGVADTHAHHVQYVAFNHPVTGEGMDLSVTKHVQCCAEDGCEVCATVVTAAITAGTDTAPGDAFTAFVQNPPTELNQTLFEQHSVESPDYGIPATQEVPA